MKTQFDESWRNWIKTNVDAGRCKDGIFKILLDEGYCAEAISQEMQYRPAVAFNKLVNPFRSAQAQTAEAAQQNYGQAIAANHLFIPNAQQVDSDFLELYQLENFLTEAECAHLVALIKSQCRPSTLSSFEQDSAFRTSQTCDLGQLNDALVKAIDLRICKLLGIAQSFSEPLQGQHYDPGQEFKPHTDYFESHEMAQHAAVMGQRTFTVMIYLNTATQGGETHFPKIQTVCKPTQGLALIWNSLNADGSPNPNSLHHALPLASGYKAVITKWFRTRSHTGANAGMFTKEANEFIPNYTQQGFYKTQIPEKLFTDISSFYQTERARAQAEHVDGGFIINAKQAKSPSSLIPLSTTLRAQIHDAMKPLLEAWCGQSLEPTYVYGIREYHRDALLKTHRDRLETHIISVIINVAQQVDEDWPLYIEDNYYRSHHVLLKPGEVIFYEGARLTHGRPTALKGESFANIFCHFKPVGYIPKKMAVT
ncbi:2OG-Fe(II) oxygenase [Simiduia curdlanivorans]|uniref:2OG-Fe(II) oxygenase n=1 Tax=Simiduia curdlanivorans TaxID=1492769 RepID=A0ABV8UYV4_9GAMM|nr:2OG-Fe(II) oxygenase [Simiduia curdlanivorans]MDN3640364.1 2OG-Fe(II) oxygenase [Simiduia curdlanivorans]